MPHLRHRHVQDFRWQSCAQPNAACGDLCAAQSGARSHRDPNQGLIAPMLQQLAYVIITPYTLYKSRTGGILARLITRTGLEMVGARMFSPSPELVEEYSNVIVSANDPQDRRIQEMLRDYIVRNLPPEPKTNRR